MRALASIALLFCTSLLAQPWQQGFAAHADITDLRIGERVMLSLIVDHRSDEAKSAVTWPAIPDSLSSHIEVVKDHGVDTLVVDPEGDPYAWRQLRVLQLTSFDTGYWAVPPFRILIGDRTFETEPILLHVRGVDVDSTSAPKDIKDIHELPFSIAWWVREHALLIATAGGIVLVAIALFLLIARMKRKKPIAVPSGKEPSLAERFLAQLSALDKERVWQQGDHKSYQSRLTDLLRGYIEERYKVPALERTTDELMQELRVSPLSLERQSQLSNMLHAADMVKFAKALPSPAENEQMMAAAIRFVQETAPTNTSPDAP